ncbi:MAG: LysM peptidoglycan-binding domain-containing protein [Elusimicrobiota bacterium]|jgi:nucleoid-associated protein YgaU
MKILLLALLLAPAVVRAESRHTVVPGDTLWDLAGRYYEDNFGWRRIADANPAPSVKDPHWIYPGQIIVIPDAAAPVSEPGPALGPDTEAQDIPREAPEPKEEPAAAPEPAPEPPAPVEKGPPFDPSASAGAIALPDALSMEIPSGQTGQTPALRRLLMPASWKEDGKVLESPERLQASQGDHVLLLIERSGVAKRQRYGVYRRTSRTEADTDPKGLYMQKIGIVEVSRKLADKDRYRALVVGAGDTVQPGDLLKLEE